MGATEIRHHVISGTFRSMNIAINKWMERGGIAVKNYHRSDSIPDGAEEQRVGHQEEEKIWTNRNSEKGGLRPRLANRNSKLKGNRLR